MTESGNPSIGLYVGVSAERGTHLLARGVDVNAGRGDLGMGFYATTTVWQAIEWAERATHGLDIRPAVLRILCDRSSFENLRAYHFDDENDLFQFVRETAGLYQRRLGQYDYLSSEVNLPLSGRIGTQLKFQTPLAEAILNSSPKRLLLFPERWAKRDFLAAKHIAAYIERCRTV